MKHFSHNSTDLNIQTSIGVGCKFMTVQIGDLPGAGFVHDDLAGSFRNIADPGILATLLDLNSVSVWDIELDQAGMLDSICNHFVDNEFEELANLLKESRDSILEMGVQAFAQHWDENLENLLYEQAAKAGKIKQSRQEKHLEQVLRKAHPLRHKKTQHPLAKHFVSNVWPAMHKDMREHFTTQ